MSNQKGKKISPKEKIKLKHVAELYVNPKLFMSDCKELAIKIKIFKIKYGEIGLETVIKLFI